MWVRPGLTHIGTEPGHRNLSMVAESGLNRKNGEVAEFHGAMAALRGGGWARNLAERLMSADQTRGRRAGVENVWRSRDAYPRHHLRLKQRLNATCGH